MNILTLNQFPLAPSAIGRFSVCSMEVADLVGCLNLRNWVDMRFRPVSVNE
jgi:hypothetical protein